MKKAPPYVDVILLDFNGTIDLYRDQLDWGKPKKVEPKVIPFKGSKVESAPLTGGKRLEFNHYTGRTEEYSGELREMVSMRLRAIPIQILGQRLRI